MADSILTGGGLAYPIPDKPTSDWFQALHSAVQQGDQRAKLTMREYEKQRDAQRAKPKPRTGPTATEAAAAYLRQQAAEKSLSGWEKTQQEAADGLAAAKEFDERAASMRRHPAGSQYYTDADGAIVVDDLLS
ncbi:hypothetical protein [Nostocoides veronense]|uniref:Uncharacterized protein n=1 Tax=Nostocoides veronense TaxID=330836 RepID=A0ABN2LY43_9MICO